MKLVSGYTACRAALLEANRLRTFGATPDLRQAAKRVAETCEAVRLEGDEALLRTVRKFDCAGLELHQLRVTPREIDGGWNEVPASARQALQRAAGNIQQFHERQPRNDWHSVSADGVWLGQRYTAIQRVGDVRTVRPGHLSFDGVDAGRPRRRRRSAAAGLGEPAAPGRISAPHDSGCGARLRHH